MACATCASITGKKRISPGPTVYEGEYWIIEHAYPVKSKGWFAIILKRHAESLNDLVPEEHAELASIQQRFIGMLHEELECEKVYVSCFSDGKDLKHVLFHVFAKPKTLRRDLVGAESFALVRVSAKEAVPPKEVARLSMALRKRWYPNEHVITMSPQQIEDFFVGHHPYDCSVGSW